MSSVQPLSEAIAAGAVAMFRYFEILKFDTLYSPLVSRLVCSEKYGSNVRSVKMGSLSHELCAGTHVASTSDMCAHAAAAP